MEQRTYYWALAGGIAGLLLHLFWHAKTGNTLFVISSHLLSAAAYTLAGAAAGFVIGKILEKR